MLPSTYTQRRQPAGWLVFTMAVALTLQPICFSHVAEAQSQSPPPLAAPPSVSPPGNDTGEPPVDTTKWTASCKQWWNECGILINQYNVWFPGERPEVSGKFCLLMCSSSTNVVTCDPAVPPSGDYCTVAAPYSPLNYTGLSVALKNLSGPIPPSLGDLASLTYLDLHGNNFSGPIPTALCKLTALQYLELGNNSLVGSIPACFSALTNLQVLDLHRNQLSGPIPTELGSMLSLQTLSLRRNMLTGAIPSNISLAQNLTNLWLDNNSFYSHLPGPLGNLVNLVSLSISDNLGINGTIPNEFTRLISLRSFNATITSLSGAMPPCFSSMPNLTHILLPPGNNFCPAEGECCSNGLPSSAPQSFLAPPNMTCPFCQTCSAFCGSCQPPPLSEGAIAGIVVACVVFVAAVLAAIIWWQWRKRFVASKLAEWEEALKRHSFHRFSLKDIRLATNNFNRANLIGEGAFGIVYCAQGPGDQLWAIKRSRMIAKDASESTVFETEVRTVSRLSHRNLVRLLGYCSERGEQILVYEFVPNGPLSTYLYATTNGPCLDFQQRLDVAIGVAEGLAYLHSSTQPAMVHRDIKPANILLDANWQAKVADFGLVKDVGDTGASVATRVVGTRGYLDPEYFSRDKVTTKADVYSFGVVLMELVTGRPASSVDPTSDNHATIHISSWTIPYIEDGDIAPISDPRIFSSEIAEHIMAICKIAKDCMQLPGKSRPEMVDVARMLRDVRRRAFGVGAEEIQLNEVPSSPLASIYSYHHQSQASGFGTDSYIEFSGPVPK